MLDEYKMPSCLHGRMYSNDKAKLSTGVLHLPKGGVFNATVVEHEAQSELQAEDKVPKQCSPVEQ